jgi:hypothetical protein
MGVPSKEPKVELNSPGKVAARKVMVKEMSEGFMTMLTPKQKLADLSATDRAWLELVATEWMDAVLANAHALDVGSDRGYSPVRD